MRFFKMHGLGNDFVLFDGRALENTDWNALAVKVCNRHTGVGADGALILLNSAAADVRMRIFNADGSEAEMCGNGIRAFARYAFENGVVRGTEFTVETGAGVMKPRIILKNGCVDGVRVDMGEPKLRCEDVPCTLGTGVVKMAPITAMGKIEPISLLAYIQVTRQVSSRMASFTCRAATLWLFFTSRSSTSKPSFSSFCKVCSTA
jgi:diaminopimelate epimerase